MTAPTKLDVDALAQEIRRVDGSNSLGAGALAEALMPFLAALPASEAGWRDMESAPKDGTPFIAAQDEWLYRCQWLRDEPDEGAPREGWFDLENLSFEEPTHWLPYSALPPLPSAPDRRAGE